VAQRHEARLALLKLVDKPGGKVGVEQLDTIDMPSTFRAACPTAPTQRGS
jgi:3-phytase